MSKWIDDYDDDVGGELADEQYRQTHMPDKIQGKWEELVNFIKREVEQINGKNNLAVRAGRVNFNPLTEDEFQVEKTSKLPARRVKVQFIKNDERLKVTRYVTDLEISDKEVPEDLPSIRFDLDKERNVILKDEEGKRLKFEKLSEQWLKPLLAK